MNNKSEVRNCTQTKRMYVGFSLSLQYHRVRVKLADKLLVDSGEIFDTAIAGGRLGMIVFGQRDVIWTRLEARCQQR